MAKPACPSAAARVIPTSDHERPLSDFWNRTDRNRDIDDEAEVEGHLPSHDNLLAFRRMPALRIDGILRRPIDDAPRNMNLLFL